MAAGGEVTMSADEKKWRAESDARTLADAEDIKSDADRLAAAQAAAQEQLDSISRVVNMYPSMKDGDQKGE